MRFSEIVSFITDGAPQFAEAWKTRPLASLSDAERGVFIKKHLDEYKIGEWTGPCHLVKCPEVKPDSTRVVLHSLIVPDDRLIELLPADRWNDEFWGEYDICKMTRKEVSMSTFLTEVGLSPAETDKVTRLINAGSSTSLIPTYYHGQAIVEQYREMNTWSASCMTGDRCDCVEIYAGNPGQICLAVFKNQDGQPRGRVLLFRPINSTDKWSVSEEAVQPGPGWKYCRIYSDGLMGSCYKEPQMTQIQQWLKAAEIEPWKDGVVYTKKGPNGLCPYLDGSTQIKHLGDKVVLYMDGNPCRDWEDADPTRTNPFGSGFEERPEHECANCGSHYDPQDEDTGHVRGWGDCCSDCYGEGVYAEDLDDVVPPDDVYPIRARRPGFEGYATDEYRRYNFRTATRVRMVRATTSDDDIAIVPVDETLEHDGQFWWWDNGEDEPHVVQKRLYVRQKDNGKPEFVLEDYTEIEFDPQYIETHDGGRIAVSICRRINCNSDSVKFKVDENGTVAAYENGKKLHLLAFTRSPFAWLLVDDEWNVKAGNMWMPSNNVADTRHGIGWNSQPDVEMSRSVVWQTMGRVVDVTHRVHPSSETPDEDSDMLSYITLRPYPMMEMQQHDEWMREGVLRDSRGVPYVVAGVARVTSSRLMFIRSQMGSLIAVFDMSADKMYRYPSIVWPSAKTIERVTRKWSVASSRANPINEEIILEWINGGEDVDSE